MKSSFVQGLRPALRSHRALLAWLPDARAALPTLILAVVAATVAPPRLGAQTWTPVGPNGGLLGEIAQSASAPDVLYAATAGNAIFRSTDHGVEWQLAGTSLGGAETIFDLIVDPNDDTVLYVSLNNLAGVGKSVDAGASWHFSSTGLPQPLPVVYTLAVHPGDPHVVYAGTIRGGPYRSGDGGETWTPPAAGAIAQVTVYALRFDASHSGTIYAATSGAGGFFKSTDDGATWVAKNAGLPAGAAVVDIAIDPTSPETLYVSTGEQIFRSDDGGETWTAGAHGGMDHLAVAPNGWVFGSSVFDVSRSTDRGVTWVSTHLPSAPIPPHGRDLIADASSPGLIFAAVASGLLASSHYGDTWLASSQGLTATNVNNVVIAKGRFPAVYASVGGLGVVVSHPSRPAAAGSNRISWQSANGNLPPQERGFGTALAIDPRHPSTLWRDTFDGVARSDDGGATWTALAIPDGCLVVLAIAVDPTRSGTVYVGGIPYENLCDDRDAHSWKTLDGGRTWQNLPIDAAAWEIDPTNSDILYDQGFSRSLDGGLTWQIIVPDVNLGANALAIDPTRPATLYEATSAGVFKSGNRGRSWHSAGRGLPHGNVTGIVVDPRNPAHVYAAVSPDDSSAVSGVFVSTNGATTWTPYGTGFPVDTPLRLVLGAADPGGLYALTQGFGLYRSSLGPAPVLTP
jgi:photosystem II stability/assembly factor-like uncharacterized protein